MDGLSNGYRADGAARLSIEPPIAERSARRQGPQAQTWPRAPSRDPSRLDRLYRLKLAGRDPERRRRRRRSLHELACWFALALLVAAALASPVRAAEPRAGTAALAAA
ncbi:hypothetical protein J5226_22035 [Lysobacter sp. K5869]|uniref:hypothetical protein n=1 Tax=Lysobacter sp. K5869 TaxID=2820808 RepID=UPI001C05F403|nr:hypothetical protein [Lysobacter sp. K5869]QWP76237.1 hypothetical protein J5226_22035 [Lysobacter sp. K5869]